MMDAALRTALRGILLGVYHAAQTGMALLEEPKPVEEEEAAPTPRKMPPTFGGPPENEAAQ